MTKSDWKVWFNLPKHNAVLSTTNFSTCSLFLNLFSINDYLSSRSQNPKMPNHGPKLGLIQRKIPETEMIKGRQDSDLQMQHWHKPFMALVQFLSQWTRYHHIFLHILQWFFMWINNCLEYLVISIHYV